jgi:hypothetical protein
MYGLALLAFLVFIVPLSSIAGCGEPGAGCIAGVNTVTAFFVALLAFLDVGVGVGAALHGVRGVSGGLAALWLCTIALAAVNFLAILSIGVLLLPGTVLAVAAALLGTFGFAPVGRGLGLWHWIELAGGMLAGGAGVITLFAVFFFPSSYSQSETGGGYTSLAQREGIGAVLPTFVVFAVIVALATAGAMRHALRHSRLGCATLWAATAALGVAVGLGAAGADTIPYLRNVGSALALTFALTLAVAVISLVTGRGRWSRLL